MRVAVIVVEETDLCSRLGVNLLGSEEMLQGAGFSDDGTEGELTAGLGDEAAGVFVLRDEGVGAGEAHVHLAAEFLSAAEGAAVDFGDEGCACDVLEEAAGGYQLLECRDSGG